MLKIRSLEHLVSALSRLPGIGPKTAARLSYSLLENSDLSRTIEDALHEVRESVHECTVCFSYTDRGPASREPSDREPTSSQSDEPVCSICDDPNRRNDILCVVEEPSGIIRIESSGAFRGRYHVLHGAISPLDHIGPDDLRIHELTARLDAHPEIRELILALDPDLEGDTTVLYLADLLGKRGLKVSRIASGVPIGADIDYVDDRTLGRALENRVEL